MEVKRHTSLYNLLSLCNRLAVCRCAVHGLPVVGMEVVVERPAHAMAIFRAVERDSFGTVSSSCRNPL